MDLKRLTGLTLLFRIELPIAAGACVVLGEILALGRVPSVGLILLGFTSFFCISAAALILNDYFDYEIDKINSPSRPLPSGVVTKRDVILLSSIVALVGFIAGYLISSFAAAVVIIVWVVGFLYNWRFKRTGILGNLMVSFSVGMTFIFGGIVVGNPFDKVVWWFAVLTALIDLGAEIGADAGDIEGDSRAGSRSVAVLWGQRKALMLSGVIFTIVVLVSSVPFVLDWLSTYYLAPIAVLDVVILYSIARLVHPRTENHRRFVKLIYMSGLVTIVSFIGIRLAV